MQIKNESLKKVELLQKQIKIYEVDKSQANNQQMALVWKQKFDEMFKITNGLMTEN